MMGHAFVVDSGCLIMEAGLPGDRRQIVMLLYPGDTIAHDMIPPGPRIAISAAVPAVLNKVERSTPGKQEPHGASIPAGLQFARAGLHCLTLGRLTGEERVATALLEMAFYLGREVAHGRAFELPLSRRDLADYLALNPDTLSRIFSRLKTSGLVTTINRRHMLVTDFAKLSALSPLSGAFREVRSRACEPPAIAP